MVARKVGDVGDKTDVEMDGAVDATLDSDGAETDHGGIPLDSGTRDKVLYTADWLLRVFLVCIAFLVWESAKTARIRQDSLTESNWSAMINKQHCMKKAQVTKALQISKGLPLWSRIVKDKTADCISSSLTLPKLCLASQNSPKKICTLIG